MKKLGHIILAIAMVIGLAFSVSAQNDDQKKPPKKPPVINPGEKPPRGNNPKGGGKGRPGKPGMASTSADTAQGDRV